MFTDSVVDLGAATKPHEIRYKRVPLCTDHACERRESSTSRLEPIRNNAPYHPFANPHGANPDEFGGSDYP